MLFKYTGRLFWLLFGFSIPQLVFAQVPANKPDAATQASVTPALTPAAYPGNIKVNYVRTRDAMSEITNEGSFNSAGYQSVKESTQYLDGLGRPVQTVVKQFSGGTSPQDIVSPVKYDAFGREAFKYIPYVSSTANGALKMDAFGEQQTFMQSQYPGEQVFYGKTEFEASPLNRPAATFSPGNSWAGSNRGIISKSMVNTDADDVIEFQTGSFIPEFDIERDDYIARFKEGELYKSVIIDEQGNAVVEYKNKSGNLVLKKVQADAAIAADFGGHNGFLCTYYIYDHLNRLVLVAPPKATAYMFTLDIWQLIGNAYTFTSMCYQYQYDGRGRMVLKKMPDAVPAFMMYDNRDRLVVTTENMGPDYYRGILYDDFNRPVVTGIFGWSLGNNDLQDYINANSGIDNNNRVVSTTGNYPDLTVYYRSNAALIYQANTSVTFEPPFSTETGAEFTAYVNGTLGNSVALTQVSDNPLPEFTPLTFTYYDNYAWTNKSFNGSYTTIINQGSYLNTGTAPTGNSPAKGMVTGTKKVNLNPYYGSPLPTKWFTDVMFYDDKGRLLQQQTDNALGGTDILGNRYNFTGATVINYLVHDNPETQTKTGVKTENIYDFAGRLASIKKFIYNNAATNTVSFQTTISENEYDVLGQLKTKSIGKKRNDQGVYTADPIEQQDYTYNIRGWLKSINKDFANGSSNHWFGMELSYDWGYQNKQFNGNIAGIKWRSKGDGVQRSYGFGYDQANRLLTADFSEGVGTAYTDNSLINFDMQMGNGTQPSTAYDANGNILAMKQWGVKGLTSELIDDLQYIYYPNSNRLADVTDAQNDPDSKLGDFKDQSLNSPERPSLAYQYDVHGNMRLDVHKGLVNFYDGTSYGQGVEYNYMNLPFHITVNEMGLNPNKKGEIYYLYDAVGGKLNKHVHERGNTTNQFTRKITNTTYSGAFIYENSAATTDALTSAGQLQYFLMEEGRIRPIKLSDGSPSYAFDYMLKDHLGNVRTVITDEQKTDVYPAATMETASKAIEMNYYSKIDETQFPVGSINDYPAGNTTDANEKVAKVLGNENKIGPGITLKVMAGDKFSLKVSSWWKTSGAANPGSPANPLLDLVSVLAPAIYGIPGTHGSLAELQNQATLGPGITDFFITKQASPATDRPKAYVNWILFDEQFKLVESSSGAEQVGDNGEFKPHVKIDLPVNKNGYLYVYVSNESPSIAVFFDNLQVTHTRGPLTEESHYYPFGLQIAGISSRALGFGGTQNRYKYNKGSELQSKEFSDGSGLDIYDTHFRQLDPQLGRWWQIDSKPDYAQSLYSAMSNNPISFNDPLGDTLRSFTALSAQKMQATITGTFSGSKATQSLFKLGKDGKTFKSISETAFAKATKNLSSDKLALATSYMTAINSSSNQVVSMVSRSQKLSNTISGLFPGNTTGADIDNHFGGGVNIPYGTNGSLSVIVTNSTANVSDFVNPSTGAAITRSSSAGELLAHETLGHGMGVTSGSATFGHEDAIQMTNMYMRSQGSNLYRDGTNHGTQVLLNAKQASGIPSIYQQNINGASAVQGTMKVFDSIYN